MRLKLHSLYNHFPKHNPVDGEPFIHCYNDKFVINKKPERNSIALLIEPRSLLPEPYRFIEEHPDKYKLIFTHDSILLSTLPNARHILYGGVWGESGTQASLWGENKFTVPQFHDVPKTKGISFCSSNKEYCYLHRQRKEWAYKLEKDIDCMGTYNGGKRVSTFDIYGEYKFSVVIENYIDDFWFTEKVCNAFANKCVPIYYGARKINYFFDVGGMVIVHNLYDLPRIIRSIKYDMDWEYGKRNKEIQTNFEKVKQYAVFEDWFFDRWGKELDDFYENTINNNHPLLQH